MYIGQVRVAAVTPRLKISHTDYNAGEIIHCVKEACKQGAGIIAFPELAITGASCGDLFFQDHLYRKNLEGLFRIAKETKKYEAVVIVGFYTRVQNSYYNCAALIQDGQICGVVPKMFSSTSREMDDSRWFAPGAGIAASLSSLSLLGHTVPFGSLIFHDEKSGLKIGIEVSGDLSAPVSPGSLLCLNGAHIVINPYAGTELVGFSPLRHSAVALASSRNLCGYIHAAAGLSESTSGGVFAGDALIAENGTILSRGRRFSPESEITTTEIDYERIRYERARLQSFGQNAAGVRKEPYAFCEAALSPIKILTDKEPVLARHYAKNPFVPGDRATFDNRCKEIFNIQASALARRIAHTGSKRIAIGISGGLDSTLALLVCVRAFALLERDPYGILAVTMPGFGTSDKTYANALSVMDLLGVEKREISIRDAVLQHFTDIGHDPGVHDVTYENAQARERTQILMDVANQEQGFVVGTSDLSETALGWSTFNGDQMSMYCVNSGVPKTLVQFVIKWVADNLLAPGLEEDRSFSRDNHALKATLEDILATPISPELLPPDAGGQIAQKTEEKIGPYILHDFFLFYTIRYGMAPEKLLFLAERIFADEPFAGEIRKWLHEFQRRFILSQYKRGSAPDGPKVGSVSLSSHGDWQMPSDVDVSVWLDF